MADSSSHSVTAGDAGPGLGYNDDMPSIENNSGSALHSASAHLILCTIQYLNNVWVRIESSSDLDVGRRPELKSDDFFFSNPTVSRYSHLDFFTFV